MVYTLIVKPEVIAPTKPTAKCPHCGGALECLGIGQRAMLKLTVLIAASSLADIDSS